MLITDTVSRLTNALEGTRFCTFSSCFVFLTSFFRSICLSDYLLPHEIRTVGTAQFVYHQDTGYVQTNCDFLHQQRAPAQS